MDKAGTKPEEQIAARVQPHEAVSAVSRSPTSVGAYHKENLFTRDLSSEQWNREKEFNLTRWKDSPQGRLAIRMFSRGVMGAAAFTWGGYYAAAKMRGYNPGKMPENWVQTIAHAYDHLAGTPIKAFVNACGHDGEKFLNFRYTVKFDGYEGMGRSLGHEVIGVTFDFGAMSIGDYWGRRIADTLDPNVKKEWINDDGSIDPGKAAKAFANNWWQAITYAAGEDWAVAVPYVLSMKHIGTPLLEHAFPGYRQDFHRNGCGGSFVVNDEGRVTGNLVNAGMADFLWRFSWYNYGTVNFREAYHWLGDKIDKTLTTGQIPELVEPDPQNPHRSAAETVVDGAEQMGTWLGRNFLKAGAYMLPSAAIFAAIRPQQHKFRGYFIHPEKGVLSYIGHDGKEMALRAHSHALDPHFNGETKVFFSNTREPAVNPWANGKFRPHSAEYTHGFLDGLLNPLATANDKIRRAANPAGLWLNGNPALLKDYAGMDIDVTNLGRRRMANGIAVMNTYVNAALAYTPYLWVKSDVLAHAWDNGRTDVALERALHGLVQLNTSEFSAGIGETFQSFMGQPLSDPERERIAQCRIVHDISPADNAYEHEATSAKCNEGVDHQMQAVPTATVQQASVRPTKQGFVERLQAHKEHAQSRMEQFKQREHPERYTAAIAPRPHPQPFTKAEARSSSYAEEITRPAGAGDFPTPGTTLH